MNDERHAGHYDPEKQIIVIGHPSAVTTAMAVGFNPPPTLESVMPIVNTDVKKLDSLIIDSPKFFHNYGYNRNSRQRQKNRAKRKSKQQRNARKKNRR